MRGDGWRDAISAVRREEKGGWKVDERKMKRKGTGDRSSWSMHVDVEHLRRREEISTLSPSHIQIQDRFERQHCFCALHLI